MDRIIADEALRQAFLNFARMVEVCDEAGHVLARVIPVLDPRQYNLEPQITREEMERRKRSKEKTYTTAEVLAYLEKL